MKYITPYLSLMIFSCSSPSLQKEKPVQDSIKSALEKIDGPANIRESINGKLMFTMSDGFEVECGNKNNNWFQVGTFIPITEDQDRNGIDSGYVLIDSISQHSITFHSKTNLWMSGGDSTQRYGFIAGYTHQKNIKPESIVEKDLEKLLQSNSKITLNEFSEHLLKFGYQSTEWPMDGYKHLKHQMIYGSWMEDPSPIDRVRLMFENDVLIAILHEREISMEGKKSYPIFRNLELLVIKEFKKAELEKFIQANIKSYQGID